MKGVDPRVLSFVNEASGERSYTRLGEIYANRYKNRTEIIAARNFHFSYILFMSLTNI